MSRDNEGSFEDLEANSSASSHNIRVVGDANSDSSISDSSRATTNTNIYSSTSPSETSSRAALGPAGNDSPSGSNAAKTGFASFINSPYNISEHKSSSQNIKNRSTGVHVRESPCGSQKEITDNQKHQQSIGESDIKTITSPCKALGCDTSDRSEEINQNVQSKRTLPRLEKARQSTTSQDSKDFPLSKMNISSNRHRKESATGKESLACLRRTNFSKSASGNKLVSDTSRSNTCDSYGNSETKSNSNRRKFIEHYYNIRTRLPTSNELASSFNIITPFNRLNECDEITNRLLSSPTRIRDQSQSISHRHRSFLDLDKPSRRSSLGTNSITGQMLCISSMDFKSLELNAKDDGRRGDKEKRDADITNSSINENDTILRESQLQLLTQQQNRSLSVCEEDTLNLRSKSGFSAHASGLNRAISLACDPRNAHMGRRMSDIIPLFGCDIQSLEQCIKFGSILPPIIDSAINYIMVNGIESVGIFRKSGVKSRILNLKDRVEANQTAKLEELNKNTEYSIYDIADLVKMWFRELKPVPLVTRELIRLISSYLESSGKTITQTVTSKPGESNQANLANIAMRSYTSIKNSDSTIKSRINSVITETHRALLSRALDFLAKISSKSEANQMTSQNLAICLTPSLCATDSNQKSVLVAQKVLEYCIDNHGKLFKL